MADLFDLKASGYFYTRLQNPTNDAVAAKITELEGGVAGMLTSSIFIILLCLPFMIPRVMGGQIYTVISGSMEPEIPVGSLVYVEGARPEDMKAGDVIAFYGGRDANAIITHRVVENRVIMGELITKGDANQTNDMNPVDYDNFIGYVKWSVPEVGVIAQILTSGEGKIAAASMIGVAVILHLLASAFERGKRDERD